MPMVEIRVLGGPNADIPAPAVRVTMKGPIEDGLDPAEVVDTIARGADAWVGPTVSRTGSGDIWVVAFPWLRSGAAEAVAEAFVRVVEEGPARPLAERIADAVAHARDAAPGPGPDLLDPAVPTVAVTGTNGKTTTTRLLGRMASEAGLKAAWSSTDGIVVAGQVVEPGDWSGPGGARAVLATPDLGLAIIETARGGLMLRGMGVSAVDVAVMTNISADHVGLHGLDTVEMLAWAKATVVRVVRPSGWAVLNAEDPLVRQFHDAGPGRPWFFAVDPSTPTQDASAPLSTIRDGRMVVEGWNAEAVDLGAVADMPVTIAGLSRENVANALAAASAGLAAGLPVTAVRAGLASFATDPTTSPGRMNIWSVPVAGGAATVILDFAHNEAGIAALMRVAAGLRAPGASVHASIGNAGDRTDEGIREVGRIAATEADTVQLAAKPSHLRGRSQQSLDALQREGIRSVGKEPVEEVPDEPTGLRSLLARARPGDVVAMMIHEDRQAVAEVLTQAGATPDDAGQIRAKAKAAGPA